MNIPVFKEYFQNLPDEDRYLMVSYLGACITRKGHSLEKLVTLTTNNTKEKEKMMESIAQEYIDRGMQKGLEKTASYMLHQLKLGIEIVQQATGLSRQELARL